jgi:hypothetical protein
MKLYKLTDSEGYTRRGERNETKWGVGVTHRATGRGGLCTSGVIHAYEHPLLASFMNPIHADVKNPILWHAEGEVTHREGQLKCGVRELTTLHKARLPKITQEQRVRISIYCALTQYNDPAFVKWANDWLSGKDRSKEAAWAAAAAAWAAEAAAAAEAWAAARAAAWAAEAWAAATTKGFDLLVIIKSVVEEGK